jgi:hypothetical protein
MRWSRRNLWLAGILAAEVLLFLWKCGHFFNGDSLFFFSHRLQGWGDIWRVFQSPDHLWQYRPLTFVIFSYLLNPLFGLNPLGYNIFPLLVHGANTLVVFGILRALGLTERAALIGAFFFGAHSVAFYVTYGVAFLPDFSYSFFYLLSVYFFLKFLHAGIRGALVVSLLFFVLALFCKEATITLPVVVFAIAFLWGKEGFRMPQESIVRALSLSFRRTFSFVLLGAVYLGYHWIVKAGQIYAPGTDHPHHFEFSLYSLHFKYKYLKWAFNLPDGLVFRFEGWANYLIALTVLVFAIPFALATIRRLWSLDRLTWCGFIWFLAVLSPVLFLRNITMNHNLYVPLVGLALLMGAWLDRVAGSFTAVDGASGRWIIAAFAAACMAAVFYNSQLAAKNSWIAEASTIAETSLRDLKMLRPTLPEGATLYFVDKSPIPRGGLQWFYDYGSLFRLFYPVQSLDVHFIEHGGRMPPRQEMPREAIVLEFDGTHLSEIRGDF